MKMISAKEAAEKWGVTTRYIQMACRGGLIPGATQWGRTWMIPSNAARPGRKQTQAALDMPMPRKSVFLAMTDLYHTPGCAEQAVAALEYHPEAQVLLEAELAYARGEIDRVYEKANYLLEKHSGLYAVLAGGMLLGFCAMWRGDIKLWEQARLHICEAPAQNQDQREIIALALAALDSSNYDITGFPEWFREGIFELLHPETLPAARVFYIKYLFVAGYAVASRQFEVKGVQGLSLMAMLPYTIEPMISQAMADKTVVAEIYLRLLCAATYHNIGKNDRAIVHIDKAIALALPDRLLGILAEHRKPLDMLLYERIQVVAPEILEQFKALSKCYESGWAILSGTVRNKKISTNLTPREREVAKLAAFGMSNAEIAEQLHISVASVKQSIRLAGSKGGVYSRDELIKIL